MAKEIPVKPIEGLKTTTPTPISKDIEEYISTLGDGKREIIGIKTGIRELDRALLGLSGVIVLGGKAGGGKTNLALHLAKQVAKNKTPVLFYSLEMAYIQIVTRLLSSLSKVGYGDILLKGNTVDKEGGKYQLPEEDKLKLMEGLGQLAELGEYIHIKTTDTERSGEITFETLKADVEYLKKKFKTEEVLVVVDHMQLFKPEGEYRDQIDKEQNLINNFKNTSTKTNATILLISQQNKAGYDSDSVTSIKGSVEIIYLADVVMFIKANKDDIGNGEYAETFKEVGSDTRELEIVKNRYNAPRRGEYALKYSMEAQYSLIEFEE